jgi:N-acetylglutamate synthase-like GNAT family acetyltransferase
MKNTQRQLSDLEYQINRARLAGTNHAYTQTEFKNYLLELGLNKYEKTILPIETMEKYPPKTKTKIILFPGVSLSEPDSFQNEIDIFLQDMGYAE